MTPNPRPTQHQPCLRCDEDIPEPAWKLVAPDHYQARCPVCGQEMDLWVGRYLREETDQ